MPMPPGNQRRFQQQPRNPQGIIRNTRQPWNRTTVAQRGMAYLGERGTDLANQVLAVDSRSRDDNPMEPEAPLSEAYQDNGYYDDMGPAYDDYDPGVRDGAFDDGGGYYDDDDRV